MRTTTRRVLILGTPVLASAALIGTGPARAQSEAAEIDRDAATALSELARSNSTAAALEPKAVGILVFPKIVKAGFIFGGQGGKGVLRVGHTIRGYYTIAAASFGFEAGVQFFSLALFFMNEAALHYLDESSGWAFGTDPNVVIIDKGAAATVNTTTLAKNVVAFPFGQEGLMGGISIQGSKITTYRPGA